ncbi:MAG: ATP-binding protein [Halorientalis sp.]
MGEVLSVPIAVKSPVELVYLAVLLLTIVAGVSLAYWVAQSYRGKSGVRTFIGMIAAGAVWILLHLSHILLTNPAVERPILFFEIFFAICTFAVFVVFVSKYTETGFHRRPLVRAGLVTLLGGLAVLMVTNRWHHLLVVDTQRHTMPFSYVSFDYGIAWLAVIVLLLALIGYSWMQLVQYLLESSGHGEMQLVLLLLGTFPIAILEAMGQFGLLPATDLHHAAYGALPFLVLSSLALFRFGLFDVQPVARNAIVESLQDPILILDHDERLTDYNEQCRAIWPAIDARVSDRFEAACPELAAEISLRGPDRTHRGRLTLHSDGKERHYSVNVSAVNRSADRTDPAWYTIVLRDVTKLEHSRWQLEKQNERLDQVASMISHDLRNPITVADGYLDIVIDDLIDDDHPGPDAIAQTTDYLTNVRGSLSRMEHIIDDVLTLAREGKTVEDPDPVDLETAASDAWDHVDTKRATLTIDDSETLLADRDRLLTILENVFRNALDHGPLDVTVGVGTTGRGFYIQDDGPGIPADRVEEVFEFGFTTHDEGTGLGLAIVRTMVESHGWTVDIDTSYDDGTRFTFRTHTAEATQPRQTIHPAE